jgi:hypothetical protein
MSITFDKVEANVDIATDRFAMPEPKPAEEPADKEGE